ncbi:hypothetical protein FUAX_40430 (plasmid) [Fulvitalea axinellae]|uniref:Uncharacterized protein n=1 Tax=Fulvitalea axinellae TaxID=1182444 RepID=A0AAU9CR19_9BACT|nr:hypothetical protein FUAX_40430 [Fulvitalea axinellae]
MRFKGQLQTAIGRMLVFHQKRIIFSVPHEFSQKEKS